MDWKIFFTKNKLLSGKEDLKFKGEDKEWLIQFCEKIIKGTY